MLHDEMNSHQLLDKFALVNSTETQFTLHHNHRARIHDSSVSGTCHMCNTCHYSSGLLLSVREEKGSKEDDRMDETRPCGHLENKNVQVSSFISGHYWSRK
jgi:hypothetical protein